MNDQPYYVPDCYIMAGDGLLPPGVTLKDIQEHYDPEPEPPEVDYGTMLEDEIMREVWRKESE